MSNTEHVIAALDRAMDVVSEISQGKRNWTMSVPARPDSDPDLVISAALRDAKAALSAQSAVQEPVSSQFYDESTGKWHNFLDERHRRNTVAAGYETRDLYTHPSSAAQVEEIRNAALERAAERCDTHHKFNKRHENYDEANTASYLAREIRALKTPAPSKGEGS